MSILTPGTRLDDRYTVVSLLAEGGMSRVYEVTDDRLPGRLVAKEMREITDDDALRKMVELQFEREAEVLSGLSHPNLSRVSDTFRHQGKRFLVEELVVGRTLEHLDPAELGERRILDYADQVLEALEFLHGNGLIYRDLKPSNVMLQDGGLIKLIDFGIVRRLSIDKTSDTLVMGTPGFAAPEQYGSEQTDQRSDVFSLGALLHHLLSGRDPTRTPFVFPPLRGLVPTVSENLARVVQRATQMEPENRFSSAREMRRALRGQAPLSAVGETFSCRVLPTSRWEQAGLALGSAALGAVSFLAFPAAPLAASVGLVMAPTLLLVQGLAQARAQGEGGLSFSVSSDGLVIGSHAEARTFRWETIRELRFTARG